MTTVTSSSSGSTKSDRLSLVALTSVALLLTLCSALIGLQLQAHGVAVFWPAAGVVLDVLQQSQAQVSTAADRVGVSTAHLIDFLLADPKLWQEANRIRVECGQKPLRSGG